MEISTLLYIFFGLLVLIAVMVIVNLRRQSAFGVAEDRDSPPPNLLNNSTFQISEIIKIRLEKNVEASKNYAEALEEKLVKGMADISALEYDSQNRKQYLKEELQFVERYAKEYCDESNYTSPVFCNKFMENVLSALNFEGDNKYNFIYESFLSLQETLKSSVDIDSILNEISTFYEKIKILCNSNNDQIKLIVDSLKHISDEISDNQSLTHSTLGNSKAEGFKHIRLQLEKSGFEFDDEKSKHIPELVVWKRILEDTKKMLRSIEDNLHDFPAFEIAVFNKEDLNYVEGDKMNVTFSVVNTKHKFCPVDTIRLFPEVSNSFDVKYEGRDESVSLKDHGRNIHEFVFNLYIHDEQTNISNLEIKFKIEYKAFNGSTKQDSPPPVRLPKIKYIAEIVNPFDEGKSGIALPGGSPLFFGRKELLHEISKDFLDESKSPKIYLLVGMPRSGKTSIMNQLASDPKWLKAKHIPIDVSAQAIQNPESFFDAMFAKIFDKLKEVEITITNQEVQKINTDKGQPWQKIAQLLTMVTNKLEKSKRKLLFVIDEYHKFSEWKEDDDEDKFKDQIYYQFPEFIKVIGDIHHKVSNIIMAGYRKLHDTSNKHHRIWTQFMGGRITEKEVENFSKNDTFSFFDGVFSKYKFKFESPALELIWFQTAGHPLLMVILGYSLFKLLIEDRKLRANTMISNKDIYSAVESFTLGDLKFLWYDDWINDDLEGKLILSCLGKHTYNYLSGDSKLYETKVPRFSLQKIKENLNDEHIRLSIITMQSVVHKLKENGAILSENEQDEERYYLRYPRFAKFTHEENLFDQAKDEYQKKKI